MENSAFFSSSPALVIVWQGSESSTDEILLWPVGLFIGYRIVTEIIIIRNQCRVFTVSFPFA